MSGGSARLDRVIEDVTVDGYGDGEEATAFASAIAECLDGASVPAELAGYATELVGVDNGGDRRGVVAVIHHQSRRHQLALFYVKVSRDAAPEVAELLEAYRRWCGR